MMEWLDPIQKLIKLTIFPALHKVSFGAGNTTYLVVFAVNLPQWIPGGSPTTLLTNRTGFLSSKPILPSNLAKTLAKNTKTCSVTAL